jgi:Cof subfamily protein (haloacid dehalogenase superfamily)
MKIPAKIIALDLDDTLLKEDLTISDYTVEILQKAAAQGIYITLCSGRTENAILPFVRRLDIAGKEMGRFIIGQNGSSIMDLHTRLPIFERFVDPQVLITANRMASEENLYSEVYDASTIYVPEANEWTEIDVKLSGLKMEVVEHYEEFLKKGHPKMVIPGDPAHLQEFQKKLQKALGDSCVIFISKPYFLEIMPKGAGKGEALLWLAEKLGIPQEMVMSFGDSMNDESMIRLAGQSVAMCNGLEYIRKIAKYITNKSNNQDGVADFIEKFVL